MPPKGSKRAAKSVENAVSSKQLDGEIETTPNKKWTDPDTELPPKQLKTKSATKRDTDDGNSTKQIVKSVTKILQMSDVSDDEDNHEHAQSHVQTNSHTAHHNKNTNSDLNDNNDDYSDNDNDYDNDNDDYLAPKFTTIKDIPAPRHGDKSHYQNNNYQSKKYSNKQCVALKFSYADYRGLCHEYSTQDLIKILIVRAHDGGQDQLRETQRQTLRAMNFECNFPQTDNHKFNHNAQYTSQTQPPSIEPKNTANAENDTYLPPSYNTRHTHQKDHHESSYVPYNMRHNNQHQKEHHESSYVPYKKHTNTQFREN